MLLTRLFFRRWQPGHLTLFSSIGESGVKVNCIGDSGLKLAASLLPPLRPHWLREQSIIKLFSTRLEVRVGRELRVTKQQSACLFKLDKDGHLVCLRESDQLFVNGIHFVLHFSSNVALRPGLVYNAHLANCPCHGTRLPVRSWA